MTFFQSIILGIVQGLTEFFPVSSSAHLGLAKWLMGIENGEHFLYFDLVCHSGTLLALVLFLRRDIAALLKSPKALLLMALALCPLVPAYFLMKPLRIAASDPAYLGFFLMFTALLLFLASLKKSQTQDVYCDRSKSVKNAKEAARDFVSGTRDVLRDTARSEDQKCAAKLTPADSHFLGGSGITLPKVKDVVCIGFMQTMALLPGISRSGSTIAAGRLLGWDWLAAARFSFLLAIPAILGGQALETLKLLRGSLAPAAEVSASCYAAGFIASFALGLVGAPVMFKIYERGIVRPFAWYCLAAGLLALWAFHA
jgi:undecaprenyl-diphosphatase